MGAGAAMAAGAGPGPGPGLAARVAFGARGARLPGGAGGGARRGRAADAEREHAQPARGRRTLLPAPPPPWGSAVGWGAAGRGGAGRGAGPGGGAEPGRGVQAAPGPLRGPHGFLRTPAPRRLPGPAPPPPSPAPAWPRPGPALAPPPGLAPPPPQARPEARLAYIQLQVLSLRLLSRVRTQRGRARSGPRFCSVRRTCARSPPGSPLPAWLRPAHLHTHCGRPGLLASLGRPGLGVRPRRPPRVAPSLGTCPSSHTEPLQVVVGWGRSAREPSARSAERETRTDPPSSRPDTCSCSREPPPHPQHTHPDPVSKPAAGSPIQTCACQPPPGRSSPLKARGFRLGPPVTLTQETGPGTQPSRMLSFLLIPTCMPATSTRSSRQNIRGLEVP
ncbi:hypothetical protein VULLAG_LOCUS3890 [Vulpes lagopus]